MFATRYDLDNWIFQCVLPCNTGMPQISMELKAVPQIVVRRLNEASSRAGCPVLITLIVEKDTGGESEESG